MEILKQLLPLVAGAIVAGISALVKTVFERRDARLTAHRQLELATRRTEFVEKWLAVSQAVDGGDGYREQVTAQAREELQEAYADAQDAMVRGRSALSDAPQRSFGSQLASLLMLQRRRRVGAYVAVAVYYALTFLVWLGFLQPTDRTVDGEPNPDYIPYWQGLVIATVVTLVLRVVFGLLANWLDGRGTAPAPGDTRSERMALPLTPGPEPQSVPMDP